MGGNEKVRKWGEEVRTRDMAPSYKEPTVQESHSLPLDWQNKRMYVRERKVRGREKNGWSRIWCSQGPMTNQTGKHQVCF